MNLLLTLALAAALPGAVDPARDIFVRWPDPQGLDLLRQAGVTVAIGPPVETFARACAAAGLTPFAETTLSKALSLGALGFRGVAIEDPGQGPLPALGGLQALVYVKPNRIAQRFSPGIPVLLDGQWPGVRSGPNVPGRGIEVATASREPWVDANSYLIAYLRALYPDRPALLGYRPDPNRGVGFESLELGLAEAVAAGGNVILTLPDDYRKALLAGDAKALAAWRSLGGAIRFLRENAGRFGRPSRSRLAVAAGTLEESGEILNLLFRRNLSPVILPAEPLADLDPARFLALVAANLKAPQAANRERILKFARAGGMVIAAGKPAWWLAPEARKTRADQDRDFYSLGQGQVVAYRQPIADPSEFALDVIDLTGVRRRDVRVWNAGAVVGLASAGEPPWLHLLNYDAPRDDEFPARVEGIFAGALLYEPGAAGPRRLKAVARGSSTEITVERLGRLGSIELIMKASMKVSKEAP